MKNFKPVYKELENLIINKLPGYIEKINKEHNYWIILKPFENKSLEENCIKTPSFPFKLEETEYEEKDRIIEDTIYTNWVNSLEKVHELFEKSLEKVLLTGKKSLKKVQEEVLYLTRRSKSNYRKHKICKYSSEKSSVWCRCLLQAFWK